MLNTPYECYESLYFVLFFAFKNEIQINKNVEPKLEPKIGYVKTIVVNYIEHTLRELRVIVLCFVFCIQK